MTSKEREEAIQFAKTRAVWWLAIQDGAAMGAVWALRALELEEGRTRGMKLSVQRKELATA